MNQNEVCIQLKIILYYDFLLIHHHHHHHSLATVSISPEFSYPKIIFPITVS